jgi:hypothetical protein
MSLTMPGLAKASNFNIQTVAIKKGKTEMNRCDHTNNHYYHLSGNQSWLAIPGKNFITKYFFKSAGSLIKRNRKLFPEHYRAG